METIELLEIVARGEDSRHQFKEDATNATSLAAEIVALANSGGGQIFIGVANDGTIRAHDTVSVDRLNQLIANAAYKFGAPSDQSVYRECARLHGRCYRCHGP